MIQDTSKTKDSDPPEHEFDVAVIGAGPMGSFAAERMARRGLDVALLEKDARPGDTTVCAGGMHQDLVKFLDLPATLIEKVLPAFRYIVNGRGFEWRFQNPTYLTIERRNLDIFLAERAVQGGVKLYTRARVVRVVPEDDTLFYQSGAEALCREIRAKVFIFADGPNSLAGRTLVPQKQNDQRLQFVGLEYDLAAPANDFDAAEIIPDPQKLPFGYIWVFPKRDHINVGLGRLNSIQGPNLRDLLEEFIAKRPELCGLSVIRRKGGVIPANIGPVLQKDNCLTIGDAAGMVNPLTGGGYVCGFVSAALAAQTCIDAFRDKRLSPETLRKYKLRLRLTKHYLVVRLMHFLLRGMASTYRLVKIPLWIPVQRIYFSAVHIAMRFVRVI